MICGEFRLSEEEPVTKEVILRMLASGFKPKEEDISIYCQRNLGLGFRKSGIPAIDRCSGWHLNENKSIIVGIEGKIFNNDEIWNGLKNDKYSTPKAVLKAYEKEGEECINRLNGGFLIVIFDERNHKFIVARDHLGIEPLFYYWDGTKVIFSSSLKALLNHDEIAKELNFCALQRYLLFNYNPGEDTFFKQVKKLRPGHALVIDNNKSLIRRYWYLSYARIEERDESEIIPRLRDLMGDAVRIRIDPGDQPPGAFISGGMDSSSVLGLMSTMVDQPIQTFSFRCLGKSYDESDYARLVSTYCHTIHNEIIFSPEDVVFIEDIVRYMDEPFCDIGIEIASYILGRTAHNRVTCVLTGDGGDELFGGHPVYVADKVVRIFEKIPSPLRELLTQALQLLPDTNKKKDFIVKAKRFSYSISFPTELHSNRWRIYYTTNELQRLCNEALLNEFKNVDPLEEVTQYYREADGLDYLSRTLYGDYNTVVDFYLRRMRLIRAFSIEGRFPLLDRHLVEYAATIPSRLKIKGYSETKYILKNLMAGFLPDEIVYRKDKLGHSVPMKNWMRESTVVKELITDTLSESAVKRRGYFNYNFIRKMIDEHLRKIHNHSHRLWALTVLELWLQKNLPPGR